MGPSNTMGFTPMRFVASANPDESQGNVSSLAPITAIIDIFRVNNWKNLRSIKPKANKRSLNFMKRKPKLNRDSSWQQESNPLTMFYHADEKLRTTILSLNRARNTSLGKFLQHIRRVHRAQKHLLATVYLIYSGVDEHRKISKDHRLHLPPNDQIELESGFSEGIFFAAQALTNGFRIRGIEYCTQDLIDPAKSLCAAMDALRFVFRTRASKSTIPPYNDLDAVLIDFDRSWTGFEAAICSSYFQLGKDPSRRSRTHDLDMFTILLSDTLIRATELNLIVSERVSYLDPEVMIFLPRLALFAGLTHFSQLVNLTDEEKCFWWLKPHAPLLRSLHLTLLELPISHLNCLEAMLAGSDPPTIQEKVSSPFSITRTLRGSSANIDPVNVPDEEPNRDLSKKPTSYFNCTSKERKQLFPKCATI
ncbi:hypothetical protein DSO57_1006854 [Entomophthora muscae]|uniref:Uncharacterized protein n=1 Tax=Entomophthora muscae TaxID=34485 RepID=A0ACC2SKL2_9FUNG|nr:hypothetical protein DSO57_1006854 [Entomophthora muscae]